MVLPLIVDRVIITEDAALSIGIVVGFERFPENNIFPCKSTTARLTVSEVSMTKSLSKTFMLNKPETVLSTDAWFNNRFKSSLCI